MLTALSTGLCVLAGTQAIEAQDNYIVVMDVDGLRRFRKPKEQEVSSVELQTKANKT